jgi:ubiquinone/menaquinone biosynthesis C-methylase UbiE
MDTVSLGSVTVTPAATTALAHAGIDATTLLERYRKGDWGDEGQRQRGLNEFAAQNGLPIFSRYTLRGDTAVLIITDGDRSATHVLLPSEVQSVEVSAKEGYAKWSKTYDSESNALIATEQPAVDRILAGLRYRTVLDAATGTGRHALPLARQGAEVTAIDESPEMLSIARRHAAGLDIRFVEASLTEPLPLASDQFDLVLCALAFSHFPDIHATCREFWRVARAGGSVLITDFHPDAFAYGWRGLVWEGYTRYELRSYPYTRDDYVASVAKAGFAVRSVVDIPFKEIPAGYTTDEMRQEVGELNFCLIVLGERL